MAEFSYKLEQFEGPLDLLLHLISKHKLNIQDIPIITLLEQYLDYIEKMKEQDIDVAGEFLEMAAKLIYIKTVSLFPQEDDGKEMKKELEGRLIEYSLCKKAAKILCDRYIGDKLYVRQQMNISTDSRYILTHSSDVLVKAYQILNIKETEKTPPKLFEFRKLVSKRVVSVTSKIVFVLRKLYSTGQARFNDIFSEMTDRSERVATFLAVLELTKSGRIKLNDDNTEIYFSKSKPDMEATWK